MKWTLLLLLSSCAALPATSSDQQADTGDECGPGVESYVAENGEEVICVNTTEPIDPCEADPDSCFVDPEPPPPFDPCDMFPEACTPTDPEDPCDVDPDSCTIPEQEQDPSFWCPDQQREGTNQGGWGTRDDGDEAKATEEAKTSALHYASNECMVSYSSFIVFPHWCARGIASSSQFSFTPVQCVRPGYPDNRVTCTTTATVTCEHYIVQLTP